MDKLKTTSVFERKRIYMWPNENDSTTLSVMRVFLKMEKKKSLSNRVDVCSWGFTFFRSGRMHNHKMIDEFKCRLRTLYDPDKQTKVKCCSWERTAWTRIWLVEGSLNFCFLYTNSNLSIKSGQFCFENPKTRYNFHLMPNVLVGNNFLFYCSVAKLKPSYMRLLPGA